MFGGLIVPSQSTGIIAFIVLLGFAELFLYVGSEDSSIQNPDIFVRINSYIAIALLSLVLIRLAVAIRVEQIMYTDLTKTLDGKEPEDEKNKYQDKNIEIHASSMPDFTHSTSEIVYDKQVTAVREKYVKKALSAYHLSISRDLLAGVVLIFIAFGAAYLPIIQYSSLLGMPAFLGIVLAVTRLLFHFRQFRPINARFTKFNHPIFELISALTQPKSQNIFFVIFGLTVVNSLLGSIWNGSFGSVVAILLIGGSYYAFVKYMKPKDDVNIKLLILRTFRINRNTSFTFEKLGRFWKHVGNIFTITDSSYLLYTYRLFAPRNLLYLVLILLVGLAGLIKNFNHLLTILIMLTFTGAVISFEFYSINRTVIRNIEGFRLRLNQTIYNPRDLADLTFKMMPTINYGNVWDQSVFELIGRCELVIMDLRGFSEEKKGCEYEINLLMDNKPIEKVLFLISYKDKENIPLILDTLLKKWEFQKPQSPNVERAKPIINMYISGAEDEKDVQGLMDKLLYMAEIEKNPEPFVAP